MQLGHSNQDANSQSIDSFHHDAWFKVMAVAWHLTRPIQFWIGQSLKLVENDAVADYWIVTRRWTATQTFVHSLRYDHLYAAIYLIWGRLCIRLCWNVLFQCWPMFFFFWRNIFVIPLAGNNTKTLKVHSDFHICFAITNGGSKVDCQHLSVV